MCDVSRPQCGCFCLSASFVLHSVGVRACEQNKSENSVFAHNSKSSETCKHCFGRMKTRIRLFNFGFAPRWAGALQTPTDVSSARYFTGNTLLLNLHFPKCLNPYHHQTHAPSTPRAQSERNERLESHSWTKVICVFALRLAQEVSAQRTHVTHTLLHTFMLVSSAVTHHSTDAMHMLFTHSAGFFFFLLMYSMYTVRACMSVFDLWHCVHYM